MNRRSFFAGLAGLAGWIGFGGGRAVSGDSACMVLARKLRPALSMALVSGFDENGDATCQFIADSGSLCGPEFKAINIGPMRFDRAITCPHVDENGQWYVFV